MKKIIAIFLISIILLSFTSCFKNNTKFEDVDIEETTSISSEEKIKQVEEMIAKINLNSEYDSSFRISVYDAQALYNELTDEEKATVSNYATLEKGKKIYDRYHELNNKICRLENVAHDLAIGLIKVGLRNPASYKENQYKFGCYEYNGKCYVRVFLSFYAENGFGGTNLESDTIYLVYNEALENIDYDKISSSNLNISSIVEYVDAQKNGKDCTAIETWLNK